MKFCIDEHKGYIVNKKVEQAPEVHFNLPGHSPNSLSVTILERSNRNDEFLLWVVKMLWICEFMSKKTLKQPYTGARKEPVVG